MCARRFLRQQPDIPQSKCDLDTAQLFHCSFIYVRQRLLVTDCTFHESSVVSEESTAHPGRLLPPFSHLSTKWQVRLTVHRTCCSSLSFMR